MQRSGLEYTFVHPDSHWPLPRSFSWHRYSNIEQELWALFPETDGRRATFLQIGLSAGLYASVLDDGHSLEPSETYILMPCPDGEIRPVRMEACRRINQGEFRRAHLTALKLVGMMNGVQHIFAEAGRLMLGSEVIGEMSKPLEE